MSSCRRFLGEQARNIYCRTQISSIMCIIYLIICGPGDKYSFFLLSTSNRVDSKRLKHSSRWQLVTVDAERTRTPWCSMQWYASAPKLPGNAYYRERRTFFSAHLLEEIHEGGPRNAIITGQADSKFHSKIQKDRITLLCRLCTVDVRMSVFFAEMFGKEVIPPSERSDSQWYPSRQWSSSRWRPWLEKTGYQWLCIWVFMPVVG